VDFKDENPELFQGLAASDYTCKALCLEHVSFPGVSTRVCNQKEKSGLVSSRHFYLRSAHQ
jgi:hypothetical protein